MLESFRVICWEKGLAWMVVLSQLHVDSNRLTGRFSSFRDRPPSIDPPLEISGFDTLP